MKLKLQHVGPIAEAELAFGDLTVLVGPQATGKSIALQLLKLMVDTGHVQDVMIRHGLDWSRKLPDFLDAYLGEGMRGIWSNAKSAIWWRGQQVDMSKIAGQLKKRKNETMFYLPAQRVLALRNGWPRPFSDYSPGDPFSVREYSEQLRQLVEKEFGGGGDLFPQPRRLKREFRELLAAHVFGDFHLRVDKIGPQKRLVLGENGGTLPYMVWSAGQREFVPLLLGMYWLMVATKTPKRGDIEWVVMEELEMGLHPRAIGVVLLMVFELLWRGYRVCLSTHSPQVLEAVWALQHLKESNASPSDLLAIFDAPNTPPLQKVASTALAKGLKVFYFDRANGEVQDISGLDPSDEESGKAGWGGLIEFSGRANDAVANAVANAEREDQP
jgi:hypothetical protein